VTKYTFRDVTLSDGTTTVSGIIYAGVKVTNRSTLTNCDYHSSSGASLGYYAESIAAEDPLQFCLTHFADRER
jgi:hypothetical protein